uniref:Si:zfos-80g12.1 n=1 Tax=Heterorhabditis bacteriophora TaxID=37862 RepID=A0A1I7XRF0_HETBA
MSRFAEAGDFGSAVKLPEPWTPLLRFTNLHQSYHELFENTINTLFYGSGNLKISTRHYIAIMAATRHRCFFLINLHEREFERTGGDRKWLKGLTYVDDRKLSYLDNINMVLAHQPWLCNGDNVNTLVRGPLIPHWSLADLTQAVVILAHTHALCSFIHAIGAIHPSSVSKCFYWFHIVRTELASIDVLRSQWSLRDKENNGEQKGEVEELLRRMARLKAAVETSEVSPNNAQHFFALADGSNGKYSLAFLFILFSFYLGSGGDSPIGESGSESPVFSQQMSFAYVDFASRTDHAKTFKSHEFTWDHGFSLINDLSPDLAQKLDEKFDLTQRLTYSFMGGYDNVDTTAYRNAVWNYIQALFGIRHDDYDYAEVNALLSREMKTFVKTTACFPHRMTDELRSAVMTEFKASEKIHVVLMIMEARLQASMLYYTRALTNFFAQTTKLSMQTKPLD